jgi:hypothetical protein
VCWRNEPDERRRRTRSFDDQHDVLRSVEQFTQLGGVQVRAVYDCHDGRSGHSLCVGPAVRSVRQGKLVAVDGVVPTRSYEIRCMRRGECSTKVRERARDPRRSPVFLRH